MTRGRRNKEPSPEVDEEEDEQVEEMDVDGAPGALKFNQSLTWPAGKAIPVAELLRRLEELCKELVSLEQEVVTRESLIPKAQELASKQLLQHKDNGVKAYALWCIVEMFRLLAPDAPYKQGQLKDIFGLFISHVVPAIAHPDDPYNGPHIKTLESLASVKSIVLLADIQGADTLILSLFTNCFDVMAGTVRDAGEHLSKNVEFHMTGLLNFMIDESSQLPEGVIDILLAQFLRADPSMLAGGKKGDVEIPQDVSPAYNMAKSVVNSNEEKMTRYIGTYFSSVFIDASETVATGKISKSKGKKRTRDESDDESGLGMPTPPADFDLDEIAKAHRLLRELWRSCPESIRNVVPQIDTQITTDNLQLRIMAVYTVGDMISGIGAAGPPTPTALDPAAYPPQSVETSIPATSSVLLTPAAPHAFPSVYPETYSAFIDRRRDKAAQVRSAWTTEAGRIIQTSAGGKGLDSDLETGLLASFADMILDADEKVRLVAVQAVSRFDFNAIVQKLCGPGGVDVSNTVLGNLATRVRDPKHSVRTAAIELLAKIWGIAAGAIVEGREYVRELFGSIPTKIFEAIYVNDRALNMVIQRVLYDSLLPISYPPIKSKSNGDLQRVPDSQGEERAPDADRLRAERLLVLLRDLDARAKQVFFSFQARRAQIAGYLLSMAEAAESGGKDNKHRLEKLATMLAQTYPEPSQAAHHFEQFFEHKDKRNLSLLRFCISPESDYKKVVNANKELIKRLEQAPASIVVCLESFVPLLRSASVFAYNRSHVPPIMAVARTDDMGLAATAHEVLKDISSKAPKVFAVHVNDLCDTLKKQAPSASSENDATSVDSLKACAGFARAGHFPANISKDRNFYQAMVKFAIYGTPPSAAKHAVTITVKSAEKKEMYIKEILKACVKNFQAGEGNHLSKLAALGQLRLLAIDEISDQDEAITEIATTILTQKTSHVDEMDTRTTDVPDSDLNAKLLALKCMVNGLRGQTVYERPLAEAEIDLASKVFKLLNTLIEHDGVLQKDDAAPEQHRVQLRLTAAKLMLKLCCNRQLDLQLSPIDFNRLTKIVQDPKSEVRSAFNTSLRKYLSQAKLRPRFYALLFLFAFEPKRDIKDRTTTFLKARAATFETHGDQILQAVFAFLVSLMAHHPDFANNSTDLEDFVDYILFYLKIVATEKNLPQTYAIAQRIKTVADGVDPEKSENLYVLSDLSEAVMRIYADIRGWSLQIIGGRAKLPSGIFAIPASSVDMEEIRNKRFLPDELAENLEDLVKERLKTKKRKATDDSRNVAKKARTSTTSTAKTDKPRKTKAPKFAKPVKTPKKRSNDALPSSERRKSSRAGGRKSYAENDDSEDDEELEQWQESAGEEQDAVDVGQSSDVEDADKAADEEANKENVGSPTPPTSQTLPASGRKQRQKIVPQKQEAAAKPKKAATTKAAAKKPPARGGGRTTRNAKKNVFDIEGSDDDELSDVPGETET